MRVVVTGATGNHGSSLVRRLSREPEIEAVTGVARRLPSWSVPKTDWVARDVTRDRLDDVLAGADAVVHLAWLIQPGRDESTTHRVNVEGSERVFEAAAQGGVGTVVHASSVGAYAPGPKDRLVDESWSTAGIDTSFYSRHKSAVERLLDAFEARHPDVRVVRMRPGLCFKREAAAEIRRLFVGPLLPSALVRRGLVPVVPKIPRLRFQAVHTDDLAEAYRLALLRPEARGAFNIAADPILDPDTLAEALGGAAQVPVPPRLVRGAAAATFKLRLQPTEPGWVDMALGVPLMDSGRARRELGWEPQRTALEAFGELFDGLHDNAGLETPPLDPGTSGPLRIREVLTGVGQTSK
jgi:nucleoside-diphosphate-sugar epimerase